MLEKQQIAFQKFKELKVGALFMEMGTGKTKIALDLVNYNKVDYLLYICPFSTIENIKNEIKKWGINCKYDVIGYESIQSSDIKYLQLLGKLEQYNETFIIADESIFIKNEETKRFNRLVALRKLCEYALILNGTPISKNEWDLYNQMYFLSPLIIGMSRLEFLNTFFKKITYKKKGQKEHSFYKFSEVNSEALKKMIEPYVFNCDLDFYNEEKEETVFVPFNNNEYYIEKENKLKEYLKDRKSETIVNMLNNLNHIVANDKDKNQKVIDYIKNKQVIVYCNYLSEIDMLKSACDCFVITGNTNNRDEIIERFKEENKPLLMTFGVGSYSLNLQFCNEIVYSSINFDYSKMIQSKARIKRIGQERDIKYTYILSNAGINQMILDNLKNKKTLEQLIKEKISKGDEEQWLKDI